VQEFRVLSFIQPHPVPVAASAPPRPLGALLSDDVEVWMDRALCAETDPEAFFPEKGGSTRDAKLVCRSCEVRAECLEYALANDERFGIWGGLSERERRRLRAQRRTLAVGA
jgi:WhiB family transcriptional regulator, redox-sensing transcriptional regulator